MRVKVFLTVIEGERMEGRSANHRRLGGRWVLWS